MFGRLGAVFFFFYKDLDDSYDQAFLENATSESSTVPLTVSAGTVAVLVLQQCPAALEGHVDYCAENCSRMPVCRAVSTPRRRISNRMNLGVRSAWSEFFFLSLIVSCRWNTEKKSTYPLKPQKIQMEEGIAWGSQCICSVGQKVYLNFSVRSYGKTRMNLLANPIHAFSSPSRTRVIVFINWNLISPFPRHL